MSFVMKIKISDVEIELDTKAQLHPEIIDTLLKQGSKTAVEMFLASGGTLSDIGTADDDELEEEE